MKVVMRGGPNDIEPGVQVVRITDENLWTVEIHIPKEQWNTLSPHDLAMRYFAPAVAQLRFTVEDRA